MLKLNKSYIYFLGLIAIIIVYSLYSIYFDLTSVPDIPGKLKHINKFAFIIIVYTVGTFALRKYTRNWMMLIWHLIHVIFIAVLLLIGLYDWYTGGITNALRNFANSSFDFLISPVLYVAMGIIQFRLLKPEKQKQDQEIGQDA